MNIYYLLNESKRAAQTAQTGAYSSLYMQEISSRLGVTATALEITKLADNAFAANDVIMVGAEELTGEQATVLAAAKAKGALVIGFATRGADDVFGITVKGTLTQENVYDAIGYFTACQCVLPAKNEGTTVPVMNDVLVVEGGKTQATVQVGDQFVPGLVAGENTYYVTFDLPHTLLKIIQGKPTPQGPSDYFPVGRVPDKRSLSYDYDSTNAAADLYVLMLEAMLWNRNVPMIHHLPAAKDGTPADVLFFYGGDDDNTSGELDERASEIMYAKGLPYHINMMPEGEHGGYTLDRAGMERITARGHEIALHYNMTGVPFTEESFKQQMGTYLEVYKDVPVSNVAHCLANVGYSEYARWQAAMGVKGDGGMSGTLNHEDINAFNIYDFGFGTAFPFYVYDDAEHKTQRINFCGIPLVYYEPRIGGQYGESDAKLRLCAENAGYYGQPICLFSHPHYVGFWNGYDSTMTLRAFDIIHNICAEKGWNVYDAGTDELCLWWMERDESTLTACDGKATLTLAGDSAMVVKLPVKGAAPTVTLDGQAVTPTVKTVGGLTYAMVVVSGKGEHTLTY